MKQLVKNDQKILGRWKIDYCNKKINNKIDLSNEDHCGPCGQYILNKTQKPILDKKVVTNQPTRRL
jgi:hypothetical protein